jgi:glycosyltransferase involved in cell wall biosynthesis
VSARVSDDEVIDSAAVQAFTEEFGDQATGLPPVAIVIAAFNEEGAIGPVVEGLPRTVGGLAAAAIVVSDGSVDATGKEARAAGALVCDVPVNRGQGAALRLGYRLAREGGADYIVTTDADGQYNPAEMESLIAPILAGQADFVTGSRTLGSEETKDPVRKLGVRVFALTISVLTGQRISDTTFGLRAMRAEVTGAVLLEQPQYQASELLIGVITHGFRVAERPATIHRRQVGKSKKGNNAFYALSFAKVVFGTWWRERRRRPAARPTAGGSGRLADGFAAGNPDAAPTALKSAPRGQQGGARGPVR